MQQIILAGAGQMGCAALRLVNKEHYNAAAFADNNHALQGGTAAGLPVLSMEQAVRRAPDGILITVAGTDRTQSIRTQLRALGFSGWVRTLQEYTDALDVRGAVWELLADRIQTVPGALAELGVYQGAFAEKINRRFPDRPLYLFDTFSGFAEDDVCAEQQNGYSRAQAGDFSDTSPAHILSRMPHPAQVVLRQGYFPDTADGLKERFAFVSLDADLYLPTLHGLQWFYPRLSPGGVILLHDYGNARFSGVRAAADAFEQQSGRLLLLPVADLHGSVMIVHP